MASESSFELTKSQKKKLIRLGIVAIAALFVWVYSQWQTQEAPAPEEFPETATEVVAMLEDLPVADKIEGVYDRSAFGSAWKDVDGNGCDTRNDILARDLTNIVYQDGSDCVIESGFIVDPYTLDEINFVRGDGNLVDIDHIVALSEAAESGAMELSTEDREAIANDPVNLLAVDAGANRQKGDKSADEWLPSNVDFHCDYVSSQILVKDKYGLSVSAAEKSTMLEVLAGC